MRERKVREGLGCIVVKPNRELIFRESVLKTPVEGSEELDPLPSVFSSVLNSFGGGQRYLI